MDNEPKPGFFTPRVRIGLISLLIASALLYVFLPRNAGIYRAVPLQSALVLECNGLLRAKALSDKATEPRWQSVVQGPLFKTAFQDADAAAKLLGHIPGVLPAFVRGKGLVAFTMHPSDSLHALFVLSLEKNINLEKGLKTNALTPKYFPHTFHGNDIYNVHLSRTERLEVAVSGNLLLFSRRATLVEDALAQLENARNWWADRPYLSDLPETPLRLQIRPSALAEQWRGQMQERWRGLPDLWAHNLEWLGISWDGTEVKALAETKGFWSKLAHWGAEADDRIYELLPDNTAFVARAGLQDVSDFFQEIGTGRNSDFDQYVLPWVGNEAALVVTEPLSPALAGDRILLLAVRDSARAVNKLRAYGQERGIVPIASGAYQMFEVSGFQSAALLQPLLGDDEAFRNPVCTLVGGYAVFAPDRSSLEIFLDKYLVNQTLASNTDLLQLRQKSPEKRRISMLLNTAYLPELLGNICAPMAADLEKMLPASSYVCLDIDPGFGPKAEMEFSSQALSGAPPETDLLWKTVFAAPVRTQPYLIEQTPGKACILAQDVQNKLYCLDAQNGAILWSKALSERILSSVKGIDFYGNGLKCYTFNTATQIFNLDENGRDVQGFPFRLPARASNGMTVADFDNSTHFNFFVCCENGKTYGFAASGKPLDGWNAIPSNGTILQPILHFQVKGKDYLAAVTEEGLLSVFGRDGAPRFPSVQMDARGITAFAADGARIYCASTEGRMYACDLQGKVSAQTFGKSATATAFGQLTGDERFEWAVLEGKKMNVGAWGTAGLSPLFATQFPEKQQFVFFAPHNRIATLDARGRRIWLFNNKGEALPGFPLGGNTACAFGNQNGVETLVAGNVNGICAYRLRL